MRATNGKESDGISRHGEGARAAASGGAGEEAEGSETEPSAESVTTVNGLEHCYLFFIVSQGCCKSRPTIYDHGAKSVL